MFKFILDKIVTISYNNNVTINESKKEDYNTQYKIYQLKKTDKFTYHFRAWEFAKRYNFSIDDYNFVYSGDNITYKNGVECKDPDMSLEILFTKFNIHRPIDFTGHSLSVSAVVELTADGKSTFYYCDSFGWKNVTEEVIMNQGRVMA